MFFYLVVSSGTVTLGDNRAIVVAGTGTIKILMFDGITRTLEVHHIPELQKNLISLSILDAHGYRFPQKMGFFESPKTLVKDFITYKGAL